jgi:hypothetical protein
MRASVSKTLSLALSFSCAQMYRSRSFIVSPSKGRKRNLAQRDAIGSMILRSEVERK